MSTSFSFPFQDCLMQKTCFNRRERWKLHRLMKLSLLNILHAVYFLPLWESTFATKLFDTRAGGKGVYKTDSIWSVTLHITSKLKNAIEKNSDDIEEVIWNKNLAKDKTKIRLSKIQILEIFYRNSQWTIFFLSLKHQFFIYVLQWSMAIKPQKMFLK